MKEGIEFARDNNIPFATVLGIPTGGHEPSRHQLAGCVFTPHGYKPGLSAMRIALTFPVQLADPGTSATTPHRTVISVGAVIFQADLSVHKIECNCGCCAAEKGSRCKHTLAMEWILMMLKPGEANGGVAGALPPPLWPDVAGAVEPVEGDAGDEAGADMNGLGVAAPGQPVAGM